MRKSRPLGDDTATGEGKIKANWRLQPSAKAKRLSARWLLHLACEIFSGHAELRRTEERKYFIAVMRGVMVRA